MADYLTRLAARAIDPDDPVLQPRLPSRYERFGADEPADDSPRPAAVWPSPDAQPDPSPDSPDSLPDPMADPSLGPLSRPVPSALASPLPDLVPGQIRDTTQILAQDPAHIPDPSEPEADVVAEAARMTAAPDREELASTPDPAADGRDRTGDEPPPLTVRLLTDVVHRLTTEDEPAPARRTPTGLAPVVRVTIGRIDVRAPAAPPPAVPPPAPPAPPGEGLAAYLRGEHRRRAR